MEFRGFIENMGLLDIPCVGGKFTWFKDNGKAMSRLDRFLISRKMLDEWGVVDQRIENRNISDHAPIRLNIGQEVSKDICNSLNVKECMLKLKSRQLWLQEGDKNSRFYHNSIKDRLRRNSITSLEGRNGRVEGVANIKSEVFSYFQVFFKEENSERPIPENLNLNSLSGGDAEWLERPFTEEGVREAVWAYDDSKSPGPDGFSLEIFKGNLGGG
ncbi:uncharacterized protein LOC131650117 [Vicia villosa]|uniref:uncharacterized protein LOC131650117 n=1 Tax=Vicia villosa TaxID=3911 RepID=UPI00273BD9B1|nr:uncharacterized protein LOC131650117 [Vicia villosa]